MANWFQALGFLLAALAAAAPCAAQDDPPAAESDAPVLWVDGRPMVQDPKAVDRLVEHFVRMYGEHLASPDWIARSMAIVGLAQIKDPRTTARIVEAMAAEKQPLVLVYAWEALFARQESLTAEQRAAWSRVGKELASKDALHGDLRVGLLRLMAAEGPTPENKRVFSALFSSTNSLDPADIRTLLAMRDALARWKSPDLVKALISAMSDRDSAYRAEILLSGLDSDVPPARSLLEEGSKEMWEKTQQAWVDWYGKASLVELSGDGKMEGHSDLIPEPEEIASAADPRWRKDLELRALRLKNLDVVFAVDSTGSMGPVIEWMRRNVAKMMRALAIVSREPRIGLVFYRDHGDAYVVKPTPLTGDGAALAKAIDDVDAKGGGDVPEAVADAIATAIKGMKWISERKVVITAGDAPPHEETMEKLTAMVKSATEDGFRFHFVKARTQFGSGDLKEFDTLATEGQGSSTWISFYDSYGETASAAGGRSSASFLARIASVDYTKEVDREVVAAVLRSVLDEAYHDRVPAFVNVLMEYVERSEPEKRQSFPRTPKPKPTTHTGPAHPPVKPAPPVDPQKR